MAVDIPLSAFTDLTGYVPVQIRRMVGRGANIFDFGAKGDGVNDDTPAFLAAVAAGVRTLVLDKVEGGFYKVTSTIALGSNLTVVAGRGRPTVKMVSPSISRLFTFSGNYSGIAGLEIDGTGGIQNDACIVISGTYNLIYDCVFTSPPSAGTGSLVISGAGAKRNKVQNCTFNTPVGVAIGLTNSCAENDIIFNNVTSSGSFGIRAGEACNQNLIQGNRLISTAVEGIATYFDTYQNRVLSNHCENAGDNGISISGYQNVVSGNVCYNNQKAGIGLWGSNNVISGNVLQDNNASNAGWAGVWVHSMYGGIGSFNAITGNTIDDSRSVPLQDGVKFNASGYTPWAQGRTITAGDGNTEWTVNGLNVYRAANSGVTGATAPVHTSGTVSDGGVSWTYIRSFTGNARPGWNMVSGNIVQRVKTSAYTDPAAWADNVLSASQSGAPSFGVLSANADAPITGYITIRDSSGTLRKLAVIT